MKISRIGNERYHARRTVNLKSPLVRWSEDKKSIEFYQSRLQDFNTSANHDYTVSLSVAELLKVHQMLLKQAEENPELWGKRLAKHAASLHAMLGIAISGSA